MIPEDLINNYQFDPTTKQLALLKDYLITHYNTQTLRHYKQTQSLLTKEEILSTMANKIIEFYSKPPSNTSTQVEKKTLAKDNKFWADDETSFNLFKTYLDNEYETSLTPDTKFKDLMTHYTKYCGNELPCTWSARYDALFKKLNIQIEKIADPRYAKQGSSSGTCYVFLCSKGSKKVNTVAELPDIGAINLQDTFNKIPFIPIPK